ncbi:MAG: hypothetical protein JSV56_07225 [Methanomassiliicoccales archaeon]|nr:MAG: hypothetical protein JSV56_07225 [Methanomassiliicoccales archaeon]
MPETKKVKLKKRKLKVKGPRKVPLDDISKSEKEKSKEAALKPEEKGEEPKEEKWEIRLNFRALSKVLRHGIRFSNPNIPSEEWVECMGFLVGDVIDGKVEIKDAIPMVHGNLVEVEFQEEHYAKADEINQTLTDKNWVVGWYHTHPGHGLFLSPVDKVNQSGYQSMNPKAVALVFDPSKFRDGGELEEYIKVFRLKEPELREQSDFNEVKGIDILQSIPEVVASIYEASTLGAKDHPLILEYGEEYTKPKAEPETTVPEEKETMEREIKEMRKLIVNIHREIKLLHGNLDRHITSTKKAVEELKKSTEHKMSKKTTTCEFCGYGSIMPGDTVCGSCGKKL